MPKSSGLGLSAGTPLRDSMPFGRSIISYDTGKNHSSSFNEQVNFHI